MSAERIVIGGTDVTDSIAALAAVAPPLTSFQQAELRRLFAGTDRPAVNEQRIADIRPLGTPARTRRPDTRAA